MEVINWKKQGGKHYLFWGKGSNEKTKNIYGIQQVYFGRKQKYLWKHSYTLKEPLKNRAYVSKQPTVLFLIYQNNTSTISRLAVETIDPATQHIILKIVGYHILSFNCHILKKKSL